MKETRAMEVGNELRASRDTAAIAAANARMRGNWKNSIAAFLQMNHTETFGTDWLARYLGIPHGDLEFLCADLIAEGAVHRPEYTHYVRGVAVDWNAVHAGMAPRPAWSEDRA